MLVEERRQRVLDLVSSAALWLWPTWRRSVNVSESTIRRDWTTGTSKGPLHRTHGGAIFVGDATSCRLWKSGSSSQLEEKRAIAQTAAARIQDGDTILIDGGTTTLEVARLLVGRPLQIVTNSLPIANLFAASRGDRPGDARRLRVSEDGRRPGAVDDPHAGRRPRPPD